MTESLIQDMAEQTLRNFVAGQSDQGRLACLKAVVRVGGDLVAEFASHDAAAALHGGRAAHHHFEMNRQGVRGGRGGR